MPIWRPIAVLVALALSGGGLAAEPKDDSLQPGLLGEYFEYDTGLADYPDVALKHPATVKIDRQVNFDSTEGEFNGTGLNDQFAVRWSGKIRIKKAGHYTFFMDSDDGSRLSLDGKVAVDNGGLHGMAEKSGEVELAEGDHDILIEFFENGGGAGCKLSWSTGDAEQSIVPADILFHKKTLELDKDGKSRLARNDWPDWEF